MSSRPKGFMFDLDGTLLLSDRSLGGYEVLPGAGELLTELERRAVPFVVLTNGSAFPPAEQAAKLRALGLAVHDDRMLTPSSIAADLMIRHGVRRALVLGSAGVGHALRDAGLETVHSGEPGEREVQAVYVGWYPECTMTAIEAACHAIWAGAKLYVASDVPFFATKQGRTMGYSYAIAGAVRRVTRAPMILTGKPSLDALRFAARKLGLRRRDVGVVGDDPAVEILMARRGGATSFAVTTGVTSREEWQRQTGLRRPDHVLNRLDELLDCVAAPEGAPAAMPGSALAAKPVAASATVPAAAAHAGRPR
ncbi:MAG TPA: HAD hydrolase-like protein [Steroidobacteraceae bacterium]|nr:HAD hydrolase-like protein [Steroidobacteraceae bacterium]